MGTAARLNLASRRPWSLWWVCRSTARAGRGRSAVLAGWLIATPGLYSFCESSAGRAARRPPPRRRRARQDRSDRRRPSDLAAGRPFALCRLTTIQLALVAPDRGRLGPVRHPALAAAQPPLRPERLSRRGERWMNGGQAYVTRSDHLPSTARATSSSIRRRCCRSFALLSQLPVATVAATWIAFQIACWYRAFRILGLPPSLSLLLLAFPPVMIGLESGNVAG